MLETSQTSMTLMLLQFVELITFGICLLVAFAWLINIFSESVRSICKEASLGLSGYQHSLLLSFRKDMPD